MKPSIRLHRLSARRAAILTPLVLSIIMTFVVSAVSTLRGIGLSPAFFGTWMSAWGISWLVAFPTLLLVLPLVRRIVSLLVEPAAQLPPNRAPSPAAPRRQWRLRTRAGQASPQADDLPLKRLG